MKLVRKKLASKRGADSMKADRKHFTFCVICQYNTIVVQDKYLFRLGKVGTQHLQAKNSISSDCHLHQTTDLAKY